MAKRNIYIEVTNDPATGFTAICKNCNTVLKDRCLPVVTMIAAIYDFSAAHAKCRSARNPAAAEA